MPDYDCFLSYSHAADSRLATALRGGLHSFAKPWYRLRALRVFRDDSSLSASPHLWAGIEQALQSSRWLVLLASPRAAASAWVGRELDTWCAAGRSDRLLIVLTDGDLVWDHAANDVDWGRTTALPPVLRGRLTDEPRHVDARWVATETDISLRNPRFRDLVAELSASVHQRPKDELIGEDVRQFRRTRRWFGSLVAGLAVFAVAVSLTAWAAVDQRDRARTERDTATSRMLAAQAVTGRPTRLDRSLLLSLAALDVRDTAEARSALLGSVEYLPQLTRFLDGSGGPAGAVAVSARANLVATARNRDVVLSDATTLQPTATLTGTGATVIGIGLNADATVVTTVDAQGAVTRWRTRDRTVLGKPATAGKPVEAAAFSRDGNRMALLGDGAVTVWDGTAFTPVAAPEPVASIAVSPDGRTLAYGLEAGIRFYDLRGRRPRGPDITIAVGDYSQRVSALAYSPDGTLLASGGGGGGVITLWRTGDHQRDGEFGYIAGERAPMTAMAFDTAGTELLAADREGLLTRWDVAEQQQIGEPLPSQGVVAGLAAGPVDAAFIATTTEGAAIRWDLNRTMRLGQGLLGGASDMVSTVVFTPDGRHLAVVTLDQITVFDAATRKAVTEPLDGTYTSVAFNPAATVLAAGTTDGRVRLWDTRTWRRLPADPAGHDGDVTGVAFTPDGKLLVAVGADGTILSWDARTWQRTGAPSDTGAGETRTVAFQPGGRLIAAAGADGRIVLHDADGGVVTGAGHHGGVHGMGFSPDAETLVSTGGDGRLMLWDAGTGLPRGEPLVQEETDLGAVAFSPDGTMLAVAVGRRIVLWDVPGRQRLGDVLTGTLDAVQSLTFSRDGLLAWGSYAIAPTEELAAIADARPSSWRAVACTMAHRELTGQERSRFTGPSRPLCGPK
ncbi:toll/interleukin-1 receptor domain-containing protein [Actinoplanes rectilineatus]|uniref:toll/interleukin-1 receptor domain-containing protein n=1 Tax=Actinoplanes rectilineatus TaxID=113571 RepID=UPI0005F2C233|nr:TIR domain-containing protein [Actinoplanes rectilineatus]